MNDALPAIQQTIERKLHGAWKRERLITHLRGLSLTLICISAAVIFSLAVDWTLDLPSRWRIILTLANVLILCWVVVWHWLLRLQRFNPLHVALQVEQRYPELHSLLISYVQIDDSATESMSRWLIKAMREQAVSLTQPLDFRNIALFSGIKRIVSVCAVAVIVVVAGGLVLPEFYSVLFQRFTSPGSEVWYPTRTQITSITGDIIVRSGDPVTLSAKVGGVVPRNAVVEVVSEQMGGRSFELSGEDGQFKYNMSRAVHDFRYRFHVGDAVSRYATVNVVPPPLIVWRAIELDYPDYAGRQNDVVEMLTLEVPSGTAIRWKLELDRKLSSAELVSLRGDAVAMELSDGANGASRATAIVKADESFTYWFRWTEQEHGYVYETDARYAVRIERDSAPVVDLTGRTAAQRLRPATVNKRISANVRATDQYGLKRAWLVYAVNHQTEERMLLAELEGRVAEFEVDWPVSEDIDRLASGDVISYFVEVEGYRGTGPDGTERTTRGRSDTYRLQIVEIEEYIQYMRNVQREIERGLTDSRDAQRQSLRTVETLGQVFK